MLKNETTFLDDGSTFYGRIPLVMGTRLEMIATGSRKEVIVPVWDWLCIEAGRLDRMLNRFDPESELSKANAAGSFDSISPELEFLIMIAGRYKERTCGLFDISKGGDELDFGGFAKGYVLKGLKSVLERNGIAGAFVDFGGSSIMALGRHPFGDCWKVGVRNPFGGNVLSEMELRDQSMSTSDNAPGYSGHIIDPATGKAVTDRKVVTVIDDDPLEAEILSTAAMAAGEGSMQTLAKGFPKARISKINM